METKQNIGTYLECIKFVLEDINASMKKIDQAVLDIQEELEPKKEDLNF